MISSTSIGLIASGKVRRSTINAIEAYKFTEGSGVQRECGWCDGPGNPPRGASRGPIFVKKWS